MVAAAWVGGPQNEKDSICHNLVKLTQHSIFVLRLYSSEDMNLQVIGVILDGMG